MFSFLNRGRDFYRQTAVLAIPIVLQNLVTSTLSMADTFMVGLLGEMPMAAVTLANIPLFMVQLCIFGVQSGSCILISQYWGRKDMQSINRVVGVALWAGLLITALFAAVLLICPVEFLSLFGNQRDVVELAAQYGRWAGLSYVLNSVTMMYAAAWRSMERPKLGMYVLIFSMATNTFLNWVLIFGNLGAPALGVEGAAIATLTARVLEAVVVIIHMARNSFFRLDLALLLRPGMEMVRRFLRYSSPVVCNETLWGAGTAMLPAIMGHMEGSTEILAAYTIAGNIEKLCMVFAFGLSGAASIIIGREIGAGRDKEVRGVGAALCALGLICGAGMGVLLLLFAWLVAPSWIFPLFRLSEAAAEAAVIMIVLGAVGMPMRGFSNVNIVGVLRGGGDVRVSTIIDLIPLWIFAIPFAAVCGLVLHLDILWVYMAFPMEHVIRTGLGIWRLQSGKWVRDITRTKV